MTPRKLQAGDDHSADDTTADGSQAQREAADQQEQDSGQQEQDAPGAAPAGPPAPGLAPAPFYIATQPLYVGGVNAMPVRAYNPGDRVAADVIEPNGWAGKVRHPDDKQ